MPIIAKENGGSFALAPAGVHQAICIDVVDLGVIKTSFGGKDGESHKVKVIWEIDEEVPGKEFRFHVQKRYTLSLNEKATLRKHLDSWRGRPFTAQELTGFDVEAVIGANCQLNIVHEVREGTTWANIQAIMPLGKGTPKMTASSTYVRVRDRTPEQQDAATQITDDDVPF